MKLNVLTLSLVAALLTGCGDDARTDAEAVAEAPQCAVLTDDDANPDQIRGDPGCYTLTARGSGTPLMAALDLPAGYTNFGFFALSAIDEDEDAPFRAIQYWTVNGVHPDPCAWAGDAPQIGTSVQDLADALVAQELSRATAPEPVTLGDYDGLYLELSVAADVILEECTDGYYVEWEGKPGDAHHTVGSPGTVERIWIMDVEGTRVVLMAIGHPGTTAAQFDELTSIVESVEFVEL